MAKAETIEQVANVVEAVEETVDTLERIPNVNLNGTTKGQQVLILLVTAGVAAGAASFITYKITQKKLRDHYEEIAADEIAKSRKFFAERAAAQTEFPTPEAARDALVGEDAEEEPRKGSPTELVEEAAEAVADYSAGVLPQSEKDRLLTGESMKVSYHTIHESPQEKVEAVVEEKVNIFDKNQPTSPAEAQGFDMEAEMEKRVNGGPPYLITTDEFNEGELDYENQDLTYFEGDEVLTDSKDQPIDDIEGLVGRANMQRFGHGSDEEHIVYIRNEKLQVDFMVSRSTGTYTEEVLGLDPVEPRRTAGS